MPNGGWPQNMSTYHVAPRVEDAFGVTSARVEIVSKDGNWKVVGYAADLAIEPEEDDDWFLQRDYIAPKNYTMSMRLLPDDKGITHILYDLRKNQSKHFPGGLA